MHSNGVAQVVRGGVPSDEAPPPSDEAAGLGVVAHRVAARARAAEQWSAHERQTVLARIDEAVAVLTAARAHLLGAEARAGSWQGHGDRDVVAWRGRTSRAGESAAGAELRGAHVITTMPSVERAFTAAELSAQHVDVLGRAVSRATPSVSAALADPRTQDELVALGRRLDGREFAKAVDRFVAQVDPVTVEREHAAQRARRHLFVTDLPGGTQVRGMLDHRAGHRLRLALESAQGRPTQDDDRTSEQRRADGLVALAELALSEPEATTAVTRPHVSVVLGEQTFRTLVGALRAGDGAVGARRVERPAGARSASATLPDTGWSSAATGGSGDVERLAEAMRGVPAPVDEDGAPVPVSEVARLLCDCALTRVVVDAESRPVDVGRTQRLYSGHLRRAVVARDGGCVWPGCGRPARWCEVHHIRWWDRDGGETSVENGVVLCGFHHHAVHERDLTIERHPPAPPPRGVSSRLAAGALPPVTYTFRTRGGTVVRSAREPAALGTAAVTGDAAAPRGGATRGGATRGPGPPERREVSDPGRRAGPGFPSAGQVPGRERESDQAALFAMARPG